MKTMMLSVAVGMAACLTGMAEGTVTPVSQTPAPAKADVSTEVGTLLVSGRGCLMDGKWTEAAALFEKVRSLDPASHEAAFGLSAAYIELNRCEAALPLLEKLVKDVPDNPMVKNNLAWVLLKIKGQSAANAPRAIKLARSALLDVPSDYSIWNTLGEAYFAGGQFEKALRAAQSGLRLSTLAGVTNSPCRELVSRCRKAAGAAVLEKMESERP